MVKSHFVYGFVFAHQLLCVCAAKSPEESIVMRSQQRMAVAVDGSTESAEFVDESETVPNAPPTNGGQLVWSQGVQWRLEPNHQTANVHFIHQGSHYNFQLQPFSVFTKNASIKLQTEHGEEEHKAGTHRFFSTNNGSHYAIARLDDDGTVSGLFQSGHDLIELRPAREVQDHGLENTMFAQLKAKFKADSHVSRKLSFEALFTNIFGVQQPPNGLLDRSLSKKNDPKPPPPTATPTVSPTPIPTPRPTPPYEQWWGGGKCWKKNDNTIVDDNIIEFTISVETHANAYEKWADKVKTRVEEYISLTSFVLERQMHVRLKIGHFKVWTSTSSTPKYASTCDFDWEVKKGFRKATPQNALFILFMTGCPGRGMMVPYLCSSGRHGYVTMDSPWGFDRLQQWQYIAKFVGASLGMSNEEVPGIMSKGSTRYKEQIQYNPDKDKKWACSKIKKIINEKQCDRLWTMVSQ